MFFKENTNNTELAIQLFHSLWLGYGVDKKYKKIVDETINSLRDDTGYFKRQDLLDKIIELIPNPKTPKQRYVIAMAYAWSRASYRKNAIKYLELYLNNELYEDAYSRSS